VIDTSSPEYAERLRSLESKWWKRLINVQLPYQLHLRSIGLGRTLEIGCGIGRNLGSLQEGSIGVDHNESSIHLAQAQGLPALTTNQFEEFAASAEGSFDSLLLAHVIEHMTLEESFQLIEQYLPLVKPHGTLLVITPQEAGYRSDPSHVEFMDFAAVSRLCTMIGAEISKRYSFPFPRRAGHHFRYNEFVVKAELP